ncbi:DEAD/DEAH box helicase [Candidatus Pacearchaeota archaeon]|nr:DEAD/DEAH box helicase [Candidatus Pacearchaeota archaeon]
MNIELSHPDGYKPFDFQIEDINRGAKMRRFINGSDMGLGKTLESIATVETLNGGPTLIICPASLKINWQEEIHMWTDKKALILNNKHINSWHIYLDENYMGGMFFGNFSFYIVNYESLKKFFVYEYLKTNPKLSDIVFNPHIGLFKSVIVDESHRIRNPESQQAKLVAGVCSGKETIMLLTGTPIINKAEDLVSPLAILGRLNDFGGMRGFLNKHGDNNNLHQLKHSLSKFYFRREKKEVLKDMPDKFRSIIKIDITTKKEYNAAVDDLAQYFRDHTDKNEYEINRSMRGKAMVLIQTLTRISAIGKLKAIREIVDNTVSSGQKIILFMDRLELVDEFKRIYPDAVHITGPDNYIDRAKAQKKFQTDPYCNKMICSIKAAGVGLNLFAADVVGFVEYWWTYAVMVQCEDRAYRNGRKDNVNSIWFEGNHTIDYYKRAIIFGKKDVSERATGAVDYTKEKSQELLLRELMQNIDKLKLK